TYRELNNRANRLARSLVARNVDQEVIVAIFVERGPEFLVSILAVFKAGGAYLPIDTRYPGKRISQILEQSNASVLLTTGKLLLSVEQALQTISAENLPRVFEVGLLLQEDEPEQNLPARLLPNNLAYVIYTSGSTGAPKGAMVEQKGMVNHLYAKVTDLKL